MSNQLHKVQFIPFSLAVGWEGLVTMATTTWLGIGCLSVPKVSMIHMHVHVHVHVHVYVHVCTQLVYVWYIVYCH